MTKAIVLVFMFALNAIVKATPLTKDEIYALTRDGLSRTNPDEVLSGFFAVWPLILLILSAAFIVIVIIASLGYVTGICRSPPAKYVPAIDSSDHA